jgi:hypothetical protein
MVQNFWNHPDFLYERKYNWSRISGPTQILCVYEITTGPEYLDKPKFSV